MTMPMRLRADGKALRAQIAPDQAFDEDPMRGFVDDSDFARELARRYNAADPLQIDLILKKLLNFEILVTRTNLVPMGFDMIQGIRNDLLFIYDGEKR